MGFDNVKIFSKNLKSMSIQNLKNKKSAVGAFDPDTPFLELPIVLGTFLLISFLAIATIVTIILFDPRSFLLTSEGFNQAANYLKVPLGLLTVSIPLLALLAANHRSAQTKRQMELTRDQIAFAGEQNNFANYYKHVEVFEKFCNEHVNVENKFRFDNLRGLHNEIFPNARQGDFNSSPDVKKRLQRAAVNYFSAAEGLLKIEEKYFSIFQLFQNDEYLTKPFGISRNGDISGIEFKYIHHFQTYTYLIPGGTYFTFLKYLHAAFCATDQILKFDTNYISDSEAERVTQIYFGNWMNDQVLGHMLFDLRAGYPQAHGIIEVRDKS